MARIVMYAAKHIHAFKYALGVIAIAILVAVLTQSHVDLQTTAVAVFVVMTLMIVLFVIDVLVKIGHTKLIVLATVLAWFSTIMFMAAVVCLFTLAFLTYLQKMTDGPPPQTVPVRNISIAVNGETDRVTAKRGEPFTLNAHWEYPRLSAAARKRAPDHINLIWSVEPEESFLVNALPYPDRVRVSPGTDGFLPPSSPRTIPADIPKGEYAVTLKAGLTGFTSVRSNTVRVTIK